MAKLWPWLAAYFWIGCGQATTAPVVRLHFDTAPLTKADCPVLPSDVTVLARLVVNGDDTNACPLTFSEIQTTGAYTVSGQCTGIATGAVLQLALQWYARSPTEQKVILLAESTGTLDTTKKDRDEYDAAFNAPKTKGIATDSPSERDRFNCDRTGVDTCDTSAAPANVTSDLDTCSNLEELCMDTLFNAARTTDQCP